MPASLEINGLFQPVTSKERLGSKLGKGDIKGHKFIICITGPSNPIQIVPSSSRACCFRKHQDARRQVLPLLDFSRSKQMTALEQ
jgi:hypothetical protein